jgi:DNA (cytosine-5)-methyltransferase 1
VTLVLSLFPGIGLLDMAFEEEGFCVVRGPDLLWGGDIRRFHPPAGKFDGVIGGPPCQLFGGLANFSHRWVVKPENLIPEYERVVREADPDWFLMENVPRAPIPEIPGFYHANRVLNTRWIGEEQDRVRRFTLGARRNFFGEFHFDGQVALESVEYERTLTSAHAGGRQRMRGTMKHYSVARALELQGLPPDFFGHNNPLSEQGKKKVLAQGVPLPMGRAVAKAVKRALGISAPPEEPTK